jgi:hypothetical protein
MNSSYDASSLRKTSEKKQPAWREAKTTIIRIATDGAISQARTVAEKRSMLDNAGEADCLLLAAPAQHTGQNIFWVDNRAVAREALDAPTSREGR